MTKKKSRKKKASLRMNLMSLDSMKDLDSNGRIEEILSMVRENKLVILDGRLPGEEEMLLVQATMGKVGDEFAGIEVCTIERELTKYAEIYQKLVGMVSKKPISKSGLTFIGPSKMVKQINKMKEDSAFEVLAEV